MRIKSKAEQANEVDMTPMIDIVFQLIAFFMVITNFEQTQADERVKLPKDALAKPPTVKREFPLTINVGFERDTKGNKIDPEAWVFFGDEQFRVEQAGQKLKDEQEYFKTIGTDPKEVTVEIRADAEVPTGQVQELIKMSQEYGFEKFALRATQESN